MIVKSVRTFMGTSAERTAVGVLTYLPGDVFVETDTKDVYIQDSTQWVKMAVDGSLYLLLTGGTMTGDLVMLGASIDLGAGKLVGNAGTEGIEITSGGLVGVGTTAPDYRLHIKIGTSGATASTSYDGIIIESSAHASLSFLSPNTHVGIFNFGDPEDSDVGRILYRHPEDRMDFDVNGANRMVITSTGNVGIGTTTTRSKLTVADHITPLTNDLYDLGTSTFKWDNVWATNGTIQTSDLNNKENIIGSDLGLDFITGLRPVRYKWKDYVDFEYDKRVIGTDSDGMEITDKVLVKTSHTFKRNHYGLIAQEVETLLDGKDFAGLVKNDDGYGLRYSEFISPIITSIQELNNVILSLGARIIVMESK